VPRAKCRGLILRADPCRRIQGSHPYHAATHSNRNLSPPHAQRESRAAVAQRVGIHGARPRDAGCRRGVQAELVHSRRGGSAPAAISHVSVRPRRSLAPGREHAVSLGFWECGQRQVRQYPLRLVLPGVGRFRRAGFSFSQSRLQSAGGERIDCRGDHRLPGAVSAQPRHRVLHAVFHRLHRCPRDDHHRGQDHPVGQRPSRRR
jgi:hypothetical protein